jgi:hypothetical protein
MVFYMFKRLGDSGLSISSTVLSNDSNSRRHRSGNFPLHLTLGSVVGMASSDHRHMPQWSLLCIADSLKVAY